MGLTGDIEVAQPERWGGRKKSQGTASFSPSRRRKGEAASAENS